MANLIFGIILFIPLIWCLVKGIKAYQQEDTKSSNKIVLTITVLVAFIDLAGFVLPGADSVKNIYNSTQHVLISKRHQVLHIQEENIAVTGMDSIMPVINGDSNTVNLSLVGYGNNDASQPSEAPSPADTAAALSYETVDHFSVGWWDNAGGREEYTIEEINNGAIDGTIVFNQ